MNPMTPMAARQSYVALVGNPNCGKTALFNLLTGARQKVANYAGVTVERKQGHAQLADGGTISIVDLPGTYSLNPTTADESVTHDVLMGLRSGETPPDAIVAVVDATNLRMNLRLVLQLRALGQPMVVALNMMDVARAHGLQIDVTKLSAELGLPVVETVAIDNSLLGKGMARWTGHAVENGREALLAAAQQALATQTRKIERPDPSHQVPLDQLLLQQQVNRILAVTVPKAPRIKRFNDRIDAVVMHPVWGLVLLSALLMMIFQAVFSWANVPMDAIKEVVAAIGDFIRTNMPEGMLRSLLVDGVVAGLGGVVVFLPQILILFFFILLLEDSGYLPRAAFLLDNVMGKVGLSGRAFIPLLSSFACAIPGIMATRTIPNWRDRLATIMIAPLMTCSARLPLYALLIGAFIPARDVGMFNLQGLTLFGLYAAGILSAMAVAWIFKRTWMKSSYQPLMLELPPYRTPNLRNLLLGLWQRAAIFLQRVGTIIFAVMVLLWFLSSFPGPPPGATGAAIQYSFAGMLGHALEYVFAPIGFNWQISLALVPGMAAREVAVGALATVYSLSSTGEETAQALGPIIAQGWSMATAYSLLAWYVFAPQCISTLVVVRRETNSWRYPALMAAYLFALAYLASFITFRLVTALTHN
ncbi:MAG: ferrous iron transport protein B [Rhodoferax sp.]|uniref:ferrous iron transport protein B n=1 Tax=Rhodoferax sp. TaxID=50421 RepID=UPI00271FCA89|nr:ferrous iron transport protein B [Rhodoferax sp.]MDO8450629.1 ferrous iron transport protein B [Rhodoferax sp.]